MKLTSKFHMFMANYHIKCLEKDVKRQDELIEEKIKEIVSEVILRRDYNGKNI